MKMNDGNKQAPNSQVLDGGGRYPSPFVPLDDAVARFGQVVPNSPVPAMDNLNRLPTSQSQAQCWPPYPYAPEPNPRAMGGYDPYRAYPGFAGQFPEPTDQYSGNHTGFPISHRYQDQSAKPEHAMTGNHLLCLDDGLGYPLPETRAASLPPFSSITAQPLPPRPQSAAKEDIRGFEEGLGARLTGNSTPCHNEFGEGLSARLMERGMGVMPRDGTYTPPVQYRPWEANPGPVREGSRSQSETSQTPPSSSGFPSEKREEDGDSRSPWYRAKADSSSYSKEPNLMSLDKPSDPNANAQKNNTVPTSVDNQAETSNTYTQLTKVSHSQYQQQNRDDTGDLSRLPFTHNSFGYFSSGLPPPIGSPWEYRNDMPIKPGAEGGNGPMDPKFPLVPPTIRPGEIQTMPPHYMDDRQMQHRGQYCQNGSEGGSSNYGKTYPPMNDVQSPGMHPNPGNAQNYSGSGNMQPLKPELEQGLKGDKTGHVSSSNLQPANLKPNDGPGRGTKTPLSGGDETMEKKPKKQKRKRCGECLGCQRKDNCGECAPCRNEKSHQICKMRRCEKLIERKVSGPLSTVESVSNKLECPEAGREPSWW